MSKTHLRMGLLMGIVMFASGSLFADAVAGRVTAPFLKIPMGVRATGMGEAFTGVADDHQAMYYNPSGLALVEKPTIALMHLQGFGGVNYEYLSLVSPSSLFGMDSFGSVGLSYRLLDIQSTALTRALPDGSFDTAQAARNQNWSAGGSVLGLGWGWMANKTVGVGAELKMINQQVVETSETLVAADVGATAFFPGLAGAQMGLDLQNIGQSGPDAPLPSRIRTGLSYKTKFGPVDEHHWILSGDAAMPLGPGDEAVRLSVGTEFSFRIAGVHQLALRGGYRFRQDLGNQSGLTVGGGYAVNILGTEVGLDYAYVPFGVLGNTHRMGLTMRFGETVKKKVKKVKRTHRRLVKKESNLSPPLDLRGVGANRQASMEWTPTGQDAIGYNLYLAYKPKGPWYKLNKHAITESKQIVGSLFNNVTTYFVATSVGPDGRESKRSNMTSVVPLKGHSFVTGDEKSAVESRETTLPDLP